MKRQSETSGVWRHGRTVAFSLVLGLPIVLGGMTPSLAGGPDPLNSPMWEDMREQFFGSADYTFDPRVKVSVPSVVENQAQVPVTVDARDLGKVKKIVVFADLNPLQHTLTLTPFDAEAYVSLRMKVEQATPVRAAVLTEDGVWHVGGNSSKRPAAAARRQRWQGTWPTGR